MSSSESRPAHPAEPASDDSASPRTLRPRLDPDRSPATRARPPDPGDGLISDRLGDYVPVAVMPGASPGLGGMDKRRAFPPRPA
ncbi:MAG: hypothetical protein ACXW27_12570 [Allosphingosinicella sp.]